MLECQQQGGSVSAGMVCVCNDSACGTQMMGLCTQQCSVASQKAWASAAWLWAPQDAWLSLKSVCVQWTCLISVGDDRLLPSVSTFCQGDPIYIWHIFGWTLCRLTIHAVACCRNCSTHKQLVNIVITHAAPSCVLWLALAAVVSVVTASCGKETTWKT